MLKKKIFRNSMYTVRTRNELDSVIKECKTLDLNFIVIYSIKRMCPLVRELSISSEGFWSICAVLRLRGECKFYSRVNYISSSDILNIVRGSKDHISIAKNLAEKLGVCPYYALLRFTDLVDIIIFTYPYLFKESIWLSTFRDLDTSQTLLVIDEAHNLLNIGGVMGDSLSVKDLRKAIDEALDLSAEDIAEVLKNILSISLNNVNEKGYVYIGKDRLGIDVAFVDKVSNLAFTAIIKVMKDFEYKYNIAKLDLALSKIAKFLYSIINPDYDIFLSKDFYNHVLLSSLPINFTPLRRALEKFPAVIMMSATPPSLEFLEKSVKIPMHIFQIDAEDYGTHNYLKENSITVIFIGATTSYKSRSKAVFNIYRDLIEKVYMVTPRGITLAVYPSYEVMNAILRELVVENAFTESGHAISEIMSSIISKPKVLLNVVAGGRLAEGIEFTSNGVSLVKSVIVVGVPYPQPDEYVEKFRQSVIGSGGSYIDYYRDIAIVRILQAVGRAIRSENDYAFVVLADRRYVNPELLKRLGLRPRVVTSNINKLVQIAESYFSQVEK